MPETTYICLPYLSLPGLKKRFKVSTDAGDTIREQLIDNLETRLGTISVANGYKTALGTNIFRAREAPLNDAELPGLTFFDEDADSEQVTWGTTEHRLVINADIVATTEAGVRSAAADVVKCLGTDLQFSGLADDTLIPDTSLAMQHLANKRFGARVAFVIMFHTDRFDPYTQT